ncbi:MAG: LysE family transporter [Firmicutes bacterium]|nr:LysE family transporter [Bacillota bacterium]
MIEILIQSMLIGYSGAVMPGSLLTYTLDQSIKSGVKAGLMVSIGHSLLELLLVTLIFFGLGQALSSTPAQILIGVLGGIVLIYLGASMIKESFTGKINIDLSMAPTTKNSNMIMGGALISAANPYFTVWWAAVGLGLIMNAYNAFGFVGVILFYLGHITADFSWYLFISWLVSKTRAFISLKFYKVLIILLGLCLLGFGAGFLWNSGQLLLQYLP